MSVRGAIEGTLRALLDAEADRFEERDRQNPEPDQDDGRAASTSRRRTDADSAVPRVSRARNQPVRVAIAERYGQRRRIPPMDVAPGS